MMLIGVGGKWLSPRCSSRCACRTAPQFRLGCVSRPEFGSAGLPDIARDHLPDDDLKSHDEIFGL